MDDAPSSQAAAMMRRREAILAAAVTEFARKGYEGARITDIADRVGLSDAGVLYHFGTKRDLFHAVLSAREHPFVELLETPSATVREALDRFVDVVASTASDPDMIVFRVVMTAAAHQVDHPGSDRVLAAHRMSMRVLVPIMRAGVDSGELREDIDPRQASIELLALHDGIRSHWSVVPDEIDYASTFRRAMDGFYRQLTLR